MNNISIKVTKCGITGDKLYNVMIEVRKGLEVCHSSFTNIKDASNLKQELTRK